MQPRNYAHVDVSRASLVFAPVAATGVAGILTGLSGGAGPCRGNYEDETVTITTKEPCLCGGKNTCTYCMFREKERLRGVLRKLKAEILGLMNSAQATQYLASQHSAHAADYEFARGKNFAYDEIGQFLMKLLRTEGFDL